MNLADLADAEGPLALGRICFITAQVCDALHAAHQKQVVHRDIKPENVFISRGPDGADFARVLDFGIARHAAAGTKTQAGAVMGTPQYMAPEQAAGRPVDARADLYSVGVMLFELISGQTVAEAGTPTLGAQDARGAELPPEIRDLVEALLSLDPRNRTGSAAEVRARLLPFVRTNSHDGLMPGLPARPPQHSTQVALAEAGLQKAWTPVAVGAGVLLLIAGGAWLAIGPSSSAARVEPVVVVKPPDPVVVMPPEPAAVKPPEPVVEAPPEPVVEAQPVPVVERPARPAKKPRPAKTPVVAAAVAPSPAPIAASAARAARVEKVRQRYRALRDHAANKLTTLDRDACQDVLDAAAKGPETVSDEALSRAERVLKDAETRSGL
jgi:serine/threonine-protein kinase